MDFVFGTSFSRKVLAQFIIDKLTMEDGVLTTLRDYLPYYITVKKIPVKVLYFSGIVAMYLKE